MNRVMTSTAILLLAACGGHGSDHFGDWKAADTIAALQGAWVGPSPANLVDHAAYEITGTTVKVWRGSAETTFTLTLASPCQLGLAAADGSVAYLGVVMKDGKLTWGGGDAGLRTGDRAVMCAGLEVWAVEAGSCFEQNMSGRWKQNDGACGFRKQPDGHEAFFWTWAGKQDSAPMDGDVLWAFKADPAKKMADYASAKAALAPH